VPKLNGRLPALKSLSPELAKALAKTRGALVLNGLTTLSDDAAAALANDQHRGGLHLNGLTALSPDAARAVCKREGDLYLNGLTAIPDQTLKALAEHKSPGYARPVVYLNGLTTLSDEGAAVLAAWPKWCGELPALTILSEKAAAALAASRNWDGSLPALKALSPEVARALARRRGNLSLPGLTELSDEVAEAVAGHRGGQLSFGGLKALTPKAAAALSRHDGRLSLNGLATLPDEAAKALAGHPGDWLFLDGLATLSDEAAGALAGHGGVVSLAGLTKLSPQAVRRLRANVRVVLPEKFRAAVVHTPARADEKFVRTFLEAHCASCHDAGTKAGDFALDALAKDDVAGRVAYAAVLERLRAGDMPPPSRAERPDPADAAGVQKWIETRLDAPLPGKPADYPVREKPVDGNRLPHAILFGGPRGPSVPPPPRLWRLSPTAYHKLLSGEFNTHDLQQPFGLIQETGFRDFAALYVPDEGATSLLLANAEQIVAAQVRPHQLVNVNDNPNAAKEALWPNEARIKTATDGERELLKKGVRVRQGNDVLAPLMHPHVRPNREELEKALRQQYLRALARPPSDKELASVVTLYEDVAGDGDLPLAGKTALMAPLMTPEAILRFEVGLGAEVRPGVRMLSPREAAVAVGLALSDKRDPALLAAAAQGKLTTRAEVAGSVRRILEDPRIDKSRVLWFFREYFDYYRAPEVFKDPLPDHLQRRGVYYDPRGYVADTDLQILHVLGRDRDVLKELLTTRDAFRSHELFRPDFPAFRHLPPVAGENRREPRGDRVGVLMQPGWLVAWSTNFHNDVVRRGRWVREHLLGGRVPDLPINVAAMIPDDPHRTLRERQVVTRAAACWKCHYRMDELGLPFEDVTHYGFPRVTETVLDAEATEEAVRVRKDPNAKVFREAPLDTTGYIAFSGDPALDGPVRDAPEMLRRLADSDRVRQVFIRHVFRYFLGRNETPGDAIALQEAEKAYLDSGGSFKELLVSLLSSESFLYRTVPAQEKK
jgi:mono/diheme cytochrome c family protein